MGIQINGNTDIISATDGSLTIQGASGNLTGNLTGTATTAQGLTGTPNITVGTIGATSLNASGVVTATSFSGALTGNVTGNATGLSGTPNITVGTIGATSLNASGVITATSFSGSGANLTGIAATTDVRTNSLVVSGVSTFSGITTVTGPTLFAKQLNVSGVSTFTTLLVGTAVTISAGIITATGVIASSITASGGTTDERPAYAVTGTIRYNTVSGTMEYYDGTHWLAINAAGYRGVFAGGAVYPGGSPFTAPATNTIDYLTIAALGNAIDFGDLSNVDLSSCAVSSSTRGVFGAAAFVNNILDYVTIATTGNALDFGDDLANPISGGASNETRGLFAGGYIHNIIRYITIASTGNTVDFGDLAEQKFNLTDGSVASSTRGIFAGGSAYAPTKTNRIEYVTIASTGNATNFGDLIVNGAASGSFSSSTRGVFAIANGNVDYITIASTGNSVDFGGTTGGALNSCAGASNNIRGVFAGGYIHNGMQYVTIATTGNTIDFGDLTTLNRWNVVGCSNGHGGVQ